MLRRIIVLLVVVFGSTGIGLWWYFSATVADQEDLVPRATIPLTEREQQLEKLDSLSEGIEPLRASEYQEVLQDLERLSPQGGNQEAASTAPVIVNPTDGVDQLAPGARWENTDQIDQQLEVLKRLSP